MADAAVDSLEPGDEPRLVDPRVDLGPCSHDPVEISFVDQVNRDRPEEQGDGSQPSEGSTDGDTQAI